MFAFIWLKKFLFFSGNIFKSISLFSLLSLILACTFLTVVLFVMNGFSSSLQKSVIDMNGHIMIIAKDTQDRRRFTRPLKEYRSQIKRKNVFLSFEGLVLKSDQFRGVIFEAVSFKKFPSFLKKRILKGKVNGKQKGLIIGRSLAKELNLTVGNSLQIIVTPHNSLFKRKRKKIPVLAIMDFGSYDLNSRYIFMPLSLGQKLFEESSKVSGIRLWFNQENQIDTLLPKIRKKIPSSFQILSWKELETAFFKMIEMDKKIIFFVLFLLIIVAGFNVSSTLFVSVFRKTKEISILKAMGAPASLLFSMFLLQGLVIGIIGSVLGILFGTGIFFGLIELQKKWNFIPESVYKVNPIYIEWNYGDFFLIILTTLFVILLASFLPARKACLISIKSGLDYE